MSDKLSDVGQIAKLIWKEHRPDGLEGTLIRAVAQIRHVRDVEERAISPSAMQQKLVDIQEHAGRLMKLLGGSGPMAGGLAAKFQAAPALEFLFAADSSLTLPEISALTTTLGRVGEAAQVQIADLKCWRGRGGPARTRLASEGMIGWSRARFLCGLWVNEGWKMAWNRPAGNKSDAAQAAGCLWSAAGGSDDGNDLGNGWRRWMERAEEVARRPDQFPGDRHWLHRVQGELQSLASGL